MLDIHYYYITKYGIPIRNIWLLILYASEVYTASEDKFLDVEDNPEDLYTLVLELLCEQFEKNISKGLSCNYVNKNENLTRIRGSINFLTTESKMLMQTGKVNCSFDELTLNIPRYQYVLMTFKNALFLKGIDQFKGRLLQNISILQGLGVKDESKQTYDIHADRFGHFDYSEKVLVETCQLLNELQIPAMHKGNYLLQDLAEMSEEWLRKLFEKAVYGFYLNNLTANLWSVSHNKKLQWKFELDSITSDIMPQMEADIILKNKQTEHATIIDTKFNKILVRNRFGGEKYRNSYIYQIYAYLRSQEENGCRAFQRGMLLHPSVGEEIADKVKIQGYSLEFQTIDLTATAKEIKTRLIELV
ncbi:5-methylcytosine restriction system specificity protein McrC [Acinetobacter guillouiae]|uniref:5-methylcytosine restriction system specificity protein McrC n=1 Tax=Acinetobacter guillouiae TaxID=106649 RepID=UPI0026E2FA3F|nr:5-methylcytosine-specific restriction endonuclease system specificity protein McrC [Acinetobacter guillouiae]MDO6644085.1 5-methylcytosine-specific restriction endonuclease system specificity protein McrC [Acinetobacter guillouiae]